MNPHDIGSGCDLEKTLDCFEYIQQSIKNVRMRLEEGQYINAAFQLGETYNLIFLWADQMNTTNDKDEEDNE